MKKNEILFYVKKYQKSELLKNLLGIKNNIIKLEIMSIDHENIKTLIKFDVNNYEIENIENILSHRI
jgi:hypothetical protein